MKNHPFFGALAPGLLVLVLASCQQEQAAKPRPPAPKPLTTNAQVDSAMRKAIKVELIPNPGEKPPTPAEKAESRRRLREMFPDSTIVIKSQTPK